MSYDRNKSERSKYYDKLMEAQRIAKESMKGYYNLDHKESQIMDLSIASGRDAENAKTQRKLLWNAMKLKDQGAVPGDVEFVFGGHKIKVILDVSKFGSVRNQAIQQGIHKFPRRAVAIFLEGIECTRARKGRNKKDWDESDRLNERMASWAKEFVETMINQRTVNLRFTKQDRQDNFLGTVHVPNPARSLDKSVVWYEVGSDGKPIRQEGLLAGEKGKELNLAEMLLRRGLAKNRPNLRATDKGAEALFAAEDVAKASNSGYWKFTTVAKPEVNNGQKEVEVQKADEVTEDSEVRVTHVVNGAELFAVNMTPRNKALEKEISDTLAQFPAAAQKKGPFNAEARIFSKNMTVAGCFQGGYYRCKILKANPVEGKADYYTVHFLDYGNEARLEYKDIEYLPGNLAGKPPLARPIRLAFLKAPSQDEMMDTYQQAGMLLSDHTLERTFKIKKMNSPVPDMGNSTQQVILLDEAENVESINERMVAHGLCRLEGDIKKRTKGRSGRGGRAAVWPPRAPKGGEADRFKGEREYLEKIMKAEMQANRKHIGMFMHGDVDTDNDED